MRIIAGRYKGRRLATVRGSIRPTSDRLRESLFSILGESVRDSTWLDLFAGTGAIGLEALSRGARSVLFNDRDAEAIVLIEKNLTLCGVEEGCEVRSEDAIVLLRRLSDQPPYDFIALDPPYDYRQYRKLLDKLSKSPLCGPQTTIVLEVFKKRAEGIVPPGLGVRRSIVGGDSLQFLLRRVDPEEG